MKKILLLGGVFLALIHSNSVAQDLSRFDAEVEAIVEKGFEREPGKKVVLFTGSSSIRLWKDLQASFPKIQAVNTGFGGSTMEELLHYAEELILPYQPQMIVIYEGDNDLHMGHSTERIMKAFQTLLAKIEARLPKTKVIIIAAKPSISRWENNAAYVELNRSYKRLAKKLPFLKYADIWNPMLGGDGKPMPDIFVEDNLHMNAKGYTIWKGVLGKFVQ